MFLPAIFSLSFFWSIKFKFDSLTNTNTRFSLSCGYRAYFSPNTSWPQEILFTKNTDKYWNSTLMKPVRLEYWNKIITLIMKKKYKDTSATLFESWRNNTKSAACITTAPSVSRFISTATACDNYSYMPDMELRRLKMKALYYSDRASWENSRDYQLSFTPTILK